MQGFLRQSMCFLMCCLAQGPDTIDFLGLTRLVETYKLKGKALLNGTIYRYTATPLSANEMYDIAKTLANAKDNYTHREYTAVLKWLNLANRKRSEEDNKTIEERDIIEMKTNTYIKVDCLCSYEIDRLLNNSSSSWRKLKLKRQQKCNNKKRPCKPKVQRFHDKKDTENFEALCNGALNVSQTVIGFRNEMSESRQCHLIDNRDPILIFQPVKLEEVHVHKPYIAVLHDVLREREIQFLLDSASPKLARGPVSTHAGVGKADIKISQEVFLKLKDYDKTILNLRNRLAAATRLNVKGFSNILVVNYAAGGYYHFHTDTNFKKSTDPKKYLGKRNLLATIIMYINDVEEGGATTFPIVGAAARPRKGSATVFYNLHRNCKVNGNALHGGCPIISGEKWIATQWVTTFHQEFHYPCTLNSTE